jgi:hypothetical protein
MLRSATTKSASTPVIVKPVVPCLGSRDTPRVSVQTLCEDTVRLFEAMYGEEKEGQPPLVLVGHRSASYCPPFLRPGSADTLAFEKVTHVGISLVYQILVRSSGLSVCSPFCWPCETLSHSAEELRAPHFQQRVDRPANTCC